MQNNTELQIFLYLLGLTTPESLPSFVLTPKVLLSIWKCMQRVHAEAFLDSREAVEYMDTNAGVWNQG